MKDSNKIKPVCILKTSALCPVCGAAINFKKMNKDFCNCKKCDWRCENKCVNQVEK